MARLVDCTGPATYRMTATLFTEVVKGAKWYQASGLSRYFRSDANYPTAEAAARDRKALDISALADSVKDALATAIDQANGYPRVRVTLEIAPCKCPPQATLGTAGRREAR